MKRVVIALISFIVLVSTANAWNAKGHFVVSMLAWRQMKPEERAQIVRMLEKHPHYSAGVCIARRR
jgi:hypothetical protein